jgi:hypothetical protein
MDDKLTLDQKRTQIKQLEMRETQIYDRFLSAFEKNKTKQSEAVQ